MVDLYTYNTGSCVDRSCMTKFGIGMNTFGLAERSILRIECIDGDGDTMKMYLRGLRDWSNAFYAPATFDATSLTCSYSPFFDPSVTATGTACLAVVDGSHTYYGGIQAHPDWNHGKVMNWALYTGSGSQTLRHCSTSGPGNNGATQFKGSIWLASTGQLTWDPAAPSLTTNPTQQEVEPEGLLAVNVMSDLDSPNLFTFESGSCADRSCSADYGIGMHTLGINELSVLRLECTDYDGDVMKLFVRGIKDFDAALSAEGSMDDISSLQCSLSHRFPAGALTGSGSDCLLDDDRHTYWGWPKTAGIVGHNNGKKINWALFTPQKSQTLRHCSDAGPASANDGSTHFRAKVWVL